MKTSTITTNRTLFAATTTPIIGQASNRIAIILSAQVDTFFGVDQPAMAAGGILITPLGTPYICLHRDYYGDIVTRPWFARQPVGGALTVIEILEV